MGKRTIEPLCWSGLLRNVVPRLFCIPALCIMEWLLCHCSMMTSEMAVWIIMQEKHFSMYGVNINRLKMCIYIYIYIYNKEGEWEKLILNINCIILSLSFILVCVKSGQISIYSTNAVCVCVCVCVCVHLHLVWWGVNKVVLSPALTFSLFFLFIWGGVTRDRFLEFSGREEAGRSALTRKEILLHSRGLILGWLTNSGEDPRIDSPMCVCVCLRFPPRLVLRPWDLPPTDKAVVTATC